MIALGAALGLAGLATTVWGTYQQTKTTKRQLALQEKVANWQMKWADKYNELWETQYKPLEEMLLAEIKRTPPYQPRYDESEARAVTAVRREFAQAREMARRCIDPRCVGMQCFTAKELAIAEARAGVGAINKGYRAEEARKDTKDAQRKEEMFSMVKLGRGLNSDSLNALNGASRAAAVAGTYRPYADMMSFGKGIMGFGMQMYQNNAMNNSLNSYQQQVNRQYQPQAVGQIYSQ